MRYLSFYGAPLNMTVHPFPPYWMEVESGRPDGSTVKRIAGRDYTMLETMAQALNFTISVMPDADWEEARELCILGHCVMKRTLDVNNNTVHFFFLASVSLMISKYLHLHLLINRYTLYTYFLIYRTIMYIHIQYVCI